MPIDLAHRVISPFNENVVPPTEQVSTTEAIETVTLPPLHPLAPPPQETFSIAPQENETPEVQTSIIEPPKTPIDKTNTSISTIALETNDSATNQADQMEDMFRKGVETAHSETITAL